MKLLVFDVEGTLFSSRGKIEGTEFASTMWHPLAHSLGEEGVRREKELHDRWENGEFEKYLDWVDATYASHKELGLNKQTFEALLASAEYNTGVPKFFEKLDRSRFLPVLISGGFQELVRRAMQELKIPHGHGACEYFFDNDDGLLSYHSMTPCDWEGKYKYVKMILDEKGLNPDLDWIFVGDGKNDCDIAMRAPVSIAINAHSDLKEIATYHIDDDGDMPASFDELWKDYLDLLTEEDYIRGNQRRIEKFQQVTNDKRNAKKLSMTKRNKQEVLVLEQDYYDAPQLHLSEILEEYKVTFVGLQEHYSLFRKIEERFDKTKNFKMVAANFEHKNIIVYGGLKRRNFIFIHVDCISHSQAWQVEDLGVPFAKIRGLPGRQNDAGIYVRLMANILYRHFYEDSK